MLETVFVIGGKLFKVCLASYLLVCVCVFGSHFRGGFITWRPVNNVPPSDGSFPMLLFSYRVAWRRSSDGHFCDQETIDSGIPLPGEGSLQCDNGCNTLNDGLDYICTEFSAEEDWTTGVGSSSYTPSTDEFDAFFSGCCWVEFINGGDDDWRIRTKVDLTPRPDNELINSSPVTATFPIVRVVQNCPTTINIPAADFDGDVVRCRYAVSSSNDDECESVCQPLPGATLDQDACTLQWTPTQQGLYAAALQLEDFVDTSSPTPLSSVPLQLILQVIPGGPCSDAPSFAAGVSSGGECFPVTQGQPFMTRIIATVSDSSQSITSINTISPPGLTTTPVQQVPSSDTEYFIDVEFTASAESLPLELLCYVAVTDGGFPSEQRCIFFTATVSPPIPLAASVDSSNLLTITVDQTVQRPDTSKSVRVVYADSQQLLYNFDVSSSDLVTFPNIGGSFKIQLPLPLPEGEKFLVQLERGAIESIGGVCSFGNEAVDLPLMTRKPRKKYKTCF